MSKLKTKVQHLLKMVDSYKYFLIFKEMENGARTTAFRGHLKNFKKNALEN